MFIDRRLAALADPTRRAIVETLAKGAQSVGALSEPYDISAPAISRHLKVLEDAGLITNTRTGKSRMCSIVPQALRETRQWFDDMERFWSGSFNRLDTFLIEGDDK